MRQQLLQLLARIPVASTLAHAVARNLAGRHFVGALAVVLDGDAEPMVLLARHTFHGDRWGVPGGWVRRREDPAVACVREVREETGLDVRSGDLLGCELHAVEGVPVRYGGLTVAYRCQLVDVRSRHPEPRSVEVAEARWTPAAQAMQLVTGFERSMIARALLALSPETGRP